MKLSEFGINAKTENLPQKLFEVMKKVAASGEKVLEWDVNNIVLDKDFICEQMYISNTASEKELPKSMRRIALKLEGLSNLTIDGKGNTLLFGDRCVQIALLKSQNITLKNFVFDYITPTVSEFEVLVRGKNYIEVFVNVDTKYVIQNGKFRFANERSCPIVVQECDIAGGVTRRMNLPGWYNGKIFHNLKCQDLGGEKIIKIRLYTKLARYFTVGCTYQCAWIVRDGTGFFIDGCKNVNIDSCRFKFMHGMGVLAQLTENINITNTDFLPNKDHGRTTVAFADVMHFVNCKGVINVQNVKADGTRDDVINNHGIHFKVVKVKGNKIQCKFMHSQTYGFNCFFEGDDIEFINPTTLCKVGSAKVKSSRMLKPRVIEVELDNIAPNSTIAKNIAVENVTWTASLLVDNLETFHVPTRGILVTTRKPVVIKNCKFHKCYMPSIHISDDARSWYESGYCTNVTIENNLFDQCHDYAVSIHPENFGSKPVHKNIKITNNKFLSDNGKILTAKCVENMVFAQNNITTVQKVVVKTNYVVNCKIEY